MSNKDEKELVLATDTAPMAIFSNERQFEFASRAAVGLASSDLVPSQYRIQDVGREKAIGNCLIAMDMANRVGMNPLMVMQNLYIVHGNPGWSAQYIRAAINSSGRFTVPEYEFFGTKGEDDYGCRCYATLIAGNQKLTGPEVTVAMAKAEGWWERKGSKWPNMTDLMLRNRAVTFFSRTYCPEIMMGMQAADEIRDIKDVNPVDDQPSMSKSDIRDALVGEVVDDKPQKQAEQQPAQVEPEKTTDAKAPDETPDKVAAEPGQDIDEDDAPVWTCDELLKIIEKADTIDTVNEAISCSNSLTRPEKQKIMKAAGAKNKILAAAMKEKQNG